MDDTTFEEFEKVNAEIDILIDEEEYEEVQRLFDIDDPGILQKAFKHKTCTAELDEKWIALLGRKKLPIKSINKNRYPEFDKGSQLEPAWSRFFWAKLIRAKIQEKGTDCYLRRTDDVVAYLERNLPVIPKGKKIKKQKLILTVIYFLEMAACGTDVDIRSFADRAHRFLIRYFKNDNDFYDFYDLLARYNIGVSYFHEARYRKAALEFNYIIDEFKKLRKKNNGALSTYFLVRQGDKLLYYPAFKYRATLQLKLQLAYHAFNTIIKDIYSELQRTNEEYEYYGHSCDLIMAEASFQMGNHKQSNKSLNKVKKYLLKVNIEKKYFSKIKTVSSLSGKTSLKRSNIYGRFIDLLADEKLDEFEKSKKNLGRKFNELKVLFTCYELYVRENKEERKGYLQQISIFLKLLLYYHDDRKKDAIDFRKWAAEIYNRNNKSITELENDGKSNSHGCTCEKKGIDLRRLGSEHYDEYCKNIRYFYRKMRNDDAKTNDRNKYEEDEKDFLKRLKKREKDRDDLLWRKREINCELIELSNIRYRGYKDKFCKTCIDKEENESPNESSFEGLLSCVNAIDYNRNSANDSCLSAGDYEWIMDNWDEHFLDHLKYYSCHDGSIDPREPQYTLHFIGLQRWNSSSPAKGSSLGGGYLLYCADEKGCVKLGIAIDPGFDYIKNLFHEGFSLQDIDIVLLSHAHLDHIRDFETMVTLLLELKKRTNPGEKHKLHAIMTLGIYSRLEHIITNPGLREFIDPYIIDIKKEIDEKYLKKTEFKFFENVCKNDNRGSTTRFVVDTGGGNLNIQSLKVTIKPTPAYHNDFSQYSDSYGYTIKITDKRNGFEYNFGYTGDTSWNPDIMNSYKDCNALLVHLGSLIDRKSKDKNYPHDRFSNYNQKECFDLVKRKNHPYFVGMLHFLTEIAGWEKEDKNKPLVLMSEFGEELRGKIRYDFVARINDAFKENKQDESHENKLYVLPVDVGLDVLLRKWKDDKEERWVKCVLCNNYIPINRENVDFETYGLDEGLFCVCKTCMKSVSPDVKIDKLRQLYEVGHEFRRCTEEDKARGGTDKKP